MADSPRIDELKRRVQLDPASIAFAALAEEYRRAGQFEEAIDVCRSGLLRHPAYLSARVTLGRALLELGRYDEAREELEQVLRVAPENLAAIRGLAEIHHRRGDVPESLPEALTESAGPPLASPPQDAEAPPQPAPVREAIPVRPVPVATLSPTDPPLEVTTTSSQAAGPIRRPDEQAAALPLPPIPLQPRPAAPPLHPDAAALPALEAFLARIVRTRQTWPSTPSPR